MNKRLRISINEFKSLVYDGKEIVIKWLMILSILFPIGSLSALIYHYGFAPGKEVEHLLFNITVSSFCFYIFRYFVRLFFSFNYRQFIRQNKFETIIISWLILEGIFFTFTGNPFTHHIWRWLDIVEMNGVSNLFLQSYVLIGALFSPTENFKLFKQIKVHPAYVFISIFLFLIFAGAGLLCMPEMTVQYGSMNFLDALFTSTSASCVTGLIVVDTGTFFTMKGHVVLFFLMIFGGLNIISFGVLFAVINRLGIKIKQTAMMEDFVFQESVFNWKTLLFKVVGTAVMIELIGGLIIALIVFQHFKHVATGEVLFFSLFHAASAFNNAGFSTLTDGMYNPFLEHFYLLHVVIAALIVAGALGMGTFFDLFSLKHLRERLSLPWKKPRVGSLLNVYTTIILILIGAASYLIFEWNGVLGDKNVLESTIAAFFQSISYRTAGFNSIDFSQIATPTLLIGIFLMFIGGGPTSTAGGIKTTTFAVIFLSVIATLRGKKRIDVFNRNISKDIVTRSYVAFLFAVLFIFLGTLALSITENSLLQSGIISLGDIMFEATSAFSTVGISTGVTSHLSEAGKITIMSLMFLGRVGVITVAFVFYGNVKTNNYKYPSEHIPVG